MNKPSKAILLKLACAGLLTSTLAVAGPDAAAVRSVSVVNLTGEAVELWMNGEYRQLQTSTALLYPCLPGEKVEVQHEMKLDYLMCGENRRIDKR